MAPLVYSVLMLVDAQPGLDPVKELSTTLFGGDTNHSIFAFPVPPFEMFKAQKFKTPVSFSGYASGISTEWNRPGFLFRKG